MKCIKEIGGYFSLESNFRKTNIPGVKLNSGRNALKYVLRVFQVKELYVPYYTCPVIFDVLNEENINLNFYHIDNNLEISQLRDIPKDKFILVNNYFGIKGTYIKYLAKQFPYLIVDDAQSYYFPKIAFAHIKSPRKFFGIPDGGIALTDSHINSQLPIGTSWERCSHLLLREDCNAEQGYDEFKKNENLINNLPLEQMSNLTLSLLSQCNFNKTKNKRLKNFKFIHAILSDYNKIKINLDDDDVPMIYPFVYFKKDLKSKLIENKIFVPTYWNNIYCSCKLNKNEENLQQFLIALPIDQRYNTNDMKYIFKILKKYLI